MSDPFASAKRSLRRGYLHIGDLAQRLNAINKTGEYATFVVEPQPDGLTEVLKLQFHPLFRDEFPCIVFDAVSNFRACLDQMTYAISIKGGLTKDAAYFPIVTDAEHLKNRINGLKYLPPEIIALFRSFTPYRGENDTLWALNELCNVKKHAALIPVDLTRLRYHHQILPPSDPLNVLMRQATRVVEVGGPMTIGGSAFNAEKNEIEIGTYPVGTNARTKTEVSFAVILKHSDEAISGQHPVLLLSQIRAETERILSATEAECYRIGVFP